MMMLLRFTKTRIETSNLLEKGLIQKTVYLVGTIEKVRLFHPSYVPNIFIVFANSKLP
jgi:hypothetical protein